MPNHDLAHFTLLQHNCAHLVYFCDVQSIRTILTIYIIFLVTYPCSDDMTCQDELKSGLQTLDIADHQHSDGEQDTCSPFCDCSCCHAQVKEPEYDCLELSLPAFALIQFPFSESKLRSLTYSIWQPPRLSQSLS